MADAKPTVLLQLDPDPHPSVFDAVVAVDSGVDQLFRQGGVAPDAVRDLVHGLLFTRGPADLHRSAIFIGGSDVGRSEALLAEVQLAFFGPFRVSVLFDPNGANTTAAAAAGVAISAIEGGVDGCKAVVLGGTGPVGRRVAYLLARAGAEVTLGSRDAGRAEAAARSISEAVGRNVASFSQADADATAGVLDRANVVVSAGAAGVLLLPKEKQLAAGTIKVLIDLNAVPPTGIEGIEPTDDGADRWGAMGWGALAVGRRKMKIHKAALRALFESNDKVLDAEEIFAIAGGLG